MDRSEPMRSRTAWISIAALLAAAGACAQEAMPGQPVATRALAVRVCAPCHGADGNSRRPDVPSLAGQVAAYLDGQLHAFAAQGSERESGIMGAIAVNLSPDEMTRLASHFSHQALRPPTALERPPAGRGEQIWFAGLPGRGVASCASCHGMRGEGLPDLFPRLAGQHAPYLAMQLRRFRDGSRRSDPDAIMRRVAAHLPDPDIDALARYAALLR